MAYLHDLKFSARELSEPEQAALGTCTALTGIYEDGKLIALVPEERKAWQLATSLNRAHENG